MKAGHLASIFLKDEEDKIGELRNLSHPDDAVWIGLKEYHQSAYWTEWWWTNGMFMPYSHWAPGEPGNDSIAGCVTIGAGNLWDDIGCDYEMYGVC